MQSRDLTTIIAVIVLVLVVFGLLGGGMMMMWPGHMGFGTFGFSPLWGILMMLFWVLIIGGVGLLVVWLLRQGPRPEGGPGVEGSRALEILKERYARGEITREQYDQMRRDLEEK